MEGEGEGGRCRERRHSQRAEKKKPTTYERKRVQEKTGEKKKTNKQKEKKQTDKQEKNRKPVNQGKSYMRDCPDVDL